MSEETPPVSGVIVGRFAGSEQAHAGECRQEIRRAGGVGSVCWHVRRVSGCILLKAGSRRSKRGRRDQARNLTHPQFCAIRHDVRARSRSRDDQLPRHRIRRDGVGARGCAARDDPDLPAAGLGRARPARNLALAARLCARGAGGRGCDQLADRGHRHHQSARDHDRLGSSHRPTRVQRHRVAGSADRGDLRQAQGRRSRSPVHRPHRPGARRLFLRDQAALGAGPRRRRARASRGGRRSALARSTAG